MKKAIVPLISLAAIILVAIKHSEIVDFATDFFTNKQDIIVLAGNEYTKNYDYMYVQRSTDYVPLGYQDVLNIFYSIINNHWETFTFYCPNEYETCAEDIEKLSDSSLTLSNINNFVHPYNSFRNIETIFNNQGKVTIKINHSYSEDEITSVNEKVKNMK